MAEKPAEAAEGGPVRGETPSGEKGFIMLGREVGGPAIQVMLVIERKEPAALDLDAEAAASLHAQLGAMIEAKQH